MNKRITSPFLAEFYTLSVALIDARVVIGTTCPTQADEMRTFTDTMIDTFIIEPNMKRTLHLLWITASRCLLPFVLYPTKESFRGHNNSPENRRALRV